MRVSSIYASQLSKEINYFKIPVDPMKIAEMKGIEMREDDAVGYTGMLLVVDGEAMISIRKSIKEVTRKRFTVAHELGHYSIPGHITDQQTMFQCSEKDLTNFGKINDKEIEANWFASELLLPEEPFKERMQYKDLSKRLLEDLCSEFETSLTATGIRFVTFRPDYAIVFSENSRIRWFYAGDEFRYYLDARPGSPLHKDSLAYDFFNGVALPDMFAEVPTYAWINDYKLKRSSRVMEMSIGSRTYKHVVSFLYVDDYEEDDSDESKDLDEYKELDGHLKFKKRQ